MNSSMEEEDNIDLSLAVGIGFSYVVALMINGFIVSVTVADWMRGRPVTATDQVLTSLGITRIICQVTSLLDIFCHFFFTQGHIMYDVIGFYLFGIFFYADLWLSNFLSVVFCLKICNFRSGFFLRLKAIILHRVTHLIIGYVLVAICYFSIFFVFLGTEIPENSFNATHTEDISEVHKYMSVLWSCVLLLTFLISSVLLIISLYHHLHRMQCERTATGQLNIYYRTVKYLAVSLFSYCFYFVTDVTLWFYLESLYDLEINFILNVFPTLHSMYLIYVTARLRSCLSAVLQHGAKFGLSCRCCYPEAGDPVETIPQRL